MPGPFLDHPFHIDGQGRIATAQSDDHIRDLIHQVLFTSPGERVNRPDFGCGLQQLVFMPNDDLLAAATQALVLGALQRWLADVITVESLQISSQESRVTVDVVYSRIDTGERHSERFASAGR